MAINTLLIGALGWRILGDPWAGAVAAASFGLNPLFIDVHSWAMAEPLFLTLTLGMLWSVGKAVNASEARRSSLPGILAGLSFRTRHVGAAGIAAGTATFLWPPRGGHAKLREAFAFLAASLLAVGAWLLRNLWNSGTSTNRLITWHPIQISCRDKTTFAAWLLPGAFIAGRMTVMVGGSQGRLLIFRRSSPPRPDDPVAASRDPLGQRASPVSCVCRRAVWQPAAARREHCSARSSAAPGRAGPVGRSQVHHG
jgi:hypothetical protein